MGALQRGLHVIRDPPFRSSISEIGFQTMEQYRGFSPGEGSLTNKRLVSASLHAAGYSLDGSTNYSPAYVGTDTKKPTPCHHSPWDILNLSASVPTATAKKFDRFHLRITL